MKTVKCDLCEVTMDGGTFEDWMKAAYDHYAVAHPEVMKDTSKTKEDGGWLRREPALMLPETA